MKVTLLVWNAESIMKALGRGFQRAAAEVQMIPIDEKTSATETLGAIKNFSPDFILTHNSYVFDIRVTEGQQLEGALRQLGIPIATWFWDSPWASGSYSMVRRFCEGPLLSVDLAICVDEENRKILMQRGIQSLVVPIGVDTDSFRPQRKPLPENLRVPLLSFVGKPNTQVEGVNTSRTDILLNHCKAMTMDFEALARQTRMASQVSQEIFHRDLLRIRELFVEFFHSICWNRSQFEIHRHRFLSDAEQGLDPVSFRELSIYMGRIEFFYSWWILNDLLWLLGDQKIRVFGEDLWGQRYLYNYRWPTPQLNHEEICQVFSQSPINLCHTKWQFRTAVHERPFLISACGGFSLTDERSGLRDCFSEEEVPSYQNFDDLLEKIEFYSKNESARTACASKAHERVLKDHSYDRRAETLLDIFSKFIARGVVT